MIRKLVGFSLVILSTSTMANAAAPAAASIQEALAQSSITYLQIAFRKVTNHNDRGVMACREGLLKNDLVYHPQYLDSARLQNELHVDERFTMNDMHVRLLKTGEIQIRVTDSFISQDDLDHNFISKFSGTDQSAEGPTDLATHLTYASSWSPDGQRTDSDTMYNTYSMLNPRVTCAILQKNLSIP